MRRVRAMALTAAVSISAVGLAAVPVQAQPVVVGADALSEVRPEGARVVAVTVELTEDLPADTAVPPAGLTVTVGGAARTVLDAYITDDSGTDASAAPGRYLHVALDPTDEDAAAIYPQDLLGEYVITLDDDVTSDGVVVLPAFEVANRAVLTDVVDEFSAASFTGHSGATLNYRLFTPDGVEDDDGASPVPLVVFLHGGGEVGEDNVAQLTANQGAVAFAAPQWQGANPAYVLAPQLPLPADSQWEMPNIQHALVELVDEITAWPAVDVDRVYLVGLSRGARGALQLLPTVPDRFAGALLAAGRASQSGETEHVAALVDFPLWATHAVDDDVVSYEEGSLAFMATLEAAGATVTRGTWSGSLPPEQAEAAAAALWQEAQAAGSNTLLTTFSAGTTPVSAHHSWIPTYGNEVMREWLFAQDRGSAEPTPTAEPTVDPTDEPTPTAEPSPTGAEPQPSPSGPAEPTTPSSAAPPVDQPGGVDRGGQLPSTGAPTLALATVLGALVLGGAALLALRRRQA